MTDSDKLDDCKKEIRSILITYQKGCPLFEFNKTFKALLGKRLPYQEFGFRSDLEFLYSIPDVVKISPTTGDYHLFGIADEKSKHIQKMVIKQKATKSKAPPPRFVRQYLPPRFIEPKRAPEPRMLRRATENKYSLPPQKTFQNTSSEKTVQIAQIQRTIQNANIPKPVQNTSSEKTIQIAQIQRTIQNANIPKPVQNANIPKPCQNANIPEPVQNTSTQLNENIGAMQEVILLIDHFKGMLAMDDLLVEYKRMYNKNLSLSLYGFSCIEDCINEIPELKIVQKNKVSFIINSSHKLQESQDVRGENAFEFSSNSLDYYNDPSDRIPTPEVSSMLHSNLIQNQSCDNEKVPNSLREKFKEISQRSPDGIWASEFLSYFEEVTSEPLDLHVLGYRCLSDLIDDVPDIFIRKPVIGSRKDYVIYPAGEDKSNNNDCSENYNVPSLLVGSELVDHIVLNLRKILEAYSEGIIIDEIMHIYSINCKDSLHVQDLGFNDVETFLSSIKSRVPLKFDVVNGQKYVHLLKLSDTPTDIYSTAPEAYEKEAIPFDAVFPNISFKSICLPSDFDFSKFAPVYTSAVASPSVLYIQLHDEEVFPSFKKLAEELDLFYNGSQSELYMMKDIHIKQGASCIAKWPNDNHWYRAEITSIPSMEHVMVNYVDYGTKDVIPKSLLRYSKKEFTDLPVQALKCRLAYLRKPNNAPKWDIEARNRILSLCEDVPLMAKIENIEPDGVYSIILCDTNGDEDIFINDLLCKEKLAELDTRDTKKCENNVIDPYGNPQRMPPHYPPMQPLQALQAQFYLKAFAAIAPSFAQNEHYIELLRQVSIYCPNVDPVQNVGMTLTTPIGPPGFNNNSPNMNVSANSDVTFNAYSTSTGTFGGNLFPNTTISPESTTDCFIKAPNEQEFLSIPKQAEISREFGEYDNEVFDEDDDELFQEFCQTVSSTKVQYIKRVLSSDGFKLHIIIFESKLYASCGDISQLIWNNKEEGYLSWRLQHKDVDIPVVNLSEDGNEELFQQLKKYHVKGVQKTDFKSSISLYPLKNVIKILNHFGHPSVTLRTRIMKEINDFKPNNPDWQGFPYENLESEEEGIFSGVTDDDKIERLCLDDLLAMKEAINMKRKKMLLYSSGKGIDIASCTDEISKLEYLREKVLSRIREIKEICTTFAY